MQYFVGLDISLKMTQVCVMDGEQKIIFEKKIETDPETIALALHDLKLPFKRVGMEAGNTTSWLYAGLAKAGLPVICLDTRHTNAFLKAQLNKNDRNDARGIARMMVAAIFKPVHIKTDASQRMRTLLLARKSVQTKMVDFELIVRAMIRGFGLKMGPVSRAKWEARVRELVEGDTFLEQTVEPLLVCWRTLRVELAKLQKQVLRVTRDDPTCRLLMTCPGVGPVVSLTYKSTVDIPERFQSSQSVGASIGLTPKQYQSGEVNVNGRISKAGDHQLRTALVEAALTILTGRRNSWLKAWGLAIKARSNMQKAAIAVARKLSVILHRMWMDNTEFRWDREPELAAA